MTTPTRIYSLLLILTMLAACLMRSPALRLSSKWSFAAHSRLQPRTRHLSVLRMSSDVSYKVGFMFPGQGAQAVGMAGKLCEELPQAKELFDKASKILGYDLLQRCVEGPKESLDSTAVAQTAIFVSSMAALEKLKVEDPAAIESCTVAMGLSLGEYTALCFAGAFSFEDGVKLTKARGEAMQEAADASESGMVAVIGLDVASVEKICAAAAEKSGAQVSIANYLVDGNYAVSGAKAACEAVLQIAPEMGARMAVPLSVAGAFHTSFMEPAVEKLRAVLAEVQISPPRLPVVSNVDAQPHFDPDEIRDILARQVTSPVQWETIVTRMVKAEEFQTSYEIGPGTVCRGIVKRFGKKTPVVSVQA